MQIAWGPHYVLHQNNLGMVRLDTLVRSDTRGSRNFLRYGTCTSTKLWLATKISSTKTKTWKDEQAGIYVCYIFPSVLDTSTGEEPALSANARRQFHGHTKRIRSSRSTALFRLQYYVNAQLSPFPLTMVSWIVLTRGDWLPVPPWSHHSFSDSSTDSILCYFAVLCKEM